MTPLLTALLLYVLAQLAFGAWLSRRIRTESDYLLAGRSLGPALATFTVFATWFGAETCIGAAGEAYGGGPAAVLAEPFGYAAGVILAGLLLAVPLWKRGITTLADLFRMRYGTGVERLVALLMIPTSLLWAAAQIRAFGQVLALGSEIETTLAITLAAGVVVAYTAAGGLLADAWSDLVQGIVLIAGLIVLAFAVFANPDVPAVTEIWRGRAAATDTPALLDLIETFAVPIGGTLVAQELVSRMLGARSASLARNAAITGGLLYLAVGLIPVTLGLAAPALLPAIDDPEQVLVTLAEHTLSPVLYVVFAGALVSAILSTVDSALLVAGSLAAHNVLLGFAPDATERQKLRWNRLAVIGLGVVAWVIALASEGVYALVEEASGLGSSGILVALVFALLPVRIGGGASAALAMLAGLGVYVLGAHVIESAHPYVSSLAAAMLGYGVGLVFERGPETVLERT